MAGLSATLVASAAPLSVARRRVVLAATVGNTLEWYDFLIYGFLAVTIAKLFFPTENELTSLLLSVGTFGAAAIVRPIAGVVLGIYADRVGRKAALTLVTAVRLALRQHSSWRGAVIYGAEDTRGSARRRPST